MLSSIPINKSKVAAYLENIKTQKIFFDGMLLSQDELNSIHNEFSQKDVDLKKIKRGIHNRYSVIKNDEGELYALYSGKEGIIAQGAQGLIKIAQNLNTGDFCLVKITKAKNIDTKMYKINEARNEATYLKKRGLYLGGQERESESYPLKHYSFLPILPGLTVNELYSAIVRGPIELDKSTQAELLINLYQAILGLQHEKIIHRDLHPDNILITPQNLEVNLIDFGYALEADEEGKCFDFLASDSHQKKGKICFANGIDLYKVYASASLLVSDEELLSIVNVENLNLSSYDISRASEAYPKGRLQYHHVDVGPIVDELKAYQAALNKPSFQLPSR